MSTALEDALENDIIFGVYGPGARVTEDSIMAHYGAKRHAVRTAFANLQSRGLLAHRPNRGVEVAEHTPDEVDALYDVRIVLETAAAERTPLPVDPKITLMLDEIADRHAAAVEKEDFRNVFWLNQEFHELQFSCCNNARLRELIGIHARMAQPIRVVKYDDKEHMAEVVKQHRDIVTAMRGSSQESYVEATRKHLPASADAFRAIYERRFGGRPPNE